MIDEPTLERVVEFHGHMCPGQAIRRLDGRDLCQPCFDAALSPDQSVLLRGSGG